MENLKNDLELKELLNSLTWQSYCANRDYGMTHDQLISIGLGSEEMRVSYEILKQKNK